MTSLCRKSVTSVASAGSIHVMSETSEPTTKPTSVAPAEPPPPPRAVEPAKPPKLYVAAAWVVIVAGIVFILATVFFAGALVVGAGQCHHRMHHGMFRPGGPGGQGGPGGPGGGLQFGGPGGPGMGAPFPGGPPPAFGPGGPPPGFSPGGPASPTTTAPGSATPHP